MASATVLDAIRSERVSNKPALYLVVGAGVLSAIQVGKAPLAFEAIRAELGLDLAAASWVLSAFALVGAAVSLLVGAISDQLKARRTVIAGLVLQSVGSAIGATAGALPLLLAARALEGLGFLAVTVAAPALVVATTRAVDRKAAFAAWATFMPVGMAAVMFTAPLLGMLGWRGVWSANAVILAGYASLFLVGTRKVPEPTENATSSNIFGDMRETLSAVGPWLLAALFCAYTAAFFALFGFMPTILSERLAVADGTAGVLSATAVLAGAAGCLACGWLLGRGVHPSRLLMVGFTSIALCGVGILVLPVPAWFAYALCVIFSFVGAFIPVIIFDAAPRLVSRPQLMGSTIGLATQGNSLGIVVGPAAAGAIAGAAGWPWVALLVAAIAFLAVVLVHSCRSKLGAV